MSSVLKKQKKKQLVALYWREATKTAEVLAVGEGIRTLTGELIAPSVAVGDKVLVENGAGVSVKDGEDSVSIIREADILAVLA